MLLRAASEQRQRQRVQRERSCRSRRLISAAFLCLSLSFAPAAAWGGEATPPLPLSPEAHPRYYTNKAGSERARRNATEAPWAAAHLETARQSAARFVAMEPEALVALVPPPGSQFIVGSSLVADPATGKLLNWGGWTEPDHLVGDERQRFPNEQTPDEGPGYRDPRTGRIHYFRAAARSERVRRLETEVLPALADVYAMSGSQPHAAAAATLLDALAATSAASEAGPVDAPQRADYRNRLGRLHRPTVQVGRALENYSAVVDLIAPSGELARPSRFGKGETIGAHVARALLLDSARYALFAAALEPPPGTGRIDALRGAAAVGVLLGQRELVEPFLKGPGNVYEFADGMIDRNGFYLENAQAYESLGLELFLRSADLVEAARWHWPELAPSLYGLPKIRALFRGSFERRAVGGHFPATGQSPSDLSVVDPLRRVPPAAFRDRQEALMALELQLIWRRFLFSPLPADREAAADELTQLYANRSGGPTPLPERWPVFYLDDAIIGEADRLAPANAHSVEPRPPVSLVHGGKGLALLRSRANPSMGAQLAFGPQRMRSQREALTWLFYSDGVEWSFDPGRHNSHFRYGWSDQSVAHQSVTVNQRSIPVGTGGGALEAFLDDDHVQWAIARDQNAYANLGVGDFTRWIAQRGGRYWLDVSLIHGGKSHDDSFHAAFREVDTPPLDSWYLDALSGDRFLGNAVRPDYLITGFKGGFYDMPPGDGYSFLGQPRSTPAPQTIAVTFRSPIFPRMEERRLHLYLDGAPGRVLILCDGPRARNHPSLPYLIRRDNGPGPSWFGKVVAPTRTDASPIAGFTRLRVERGEGMAWRVDLTDGTSDLWFLRRGSEPLRVLYGEGQAFESDALCGLLALDAGGKPRHLRLSRGNTFRAPGVDARFRSTLSGHVEKITRGEAGVSLHVANAAPGALPTDAPVRIIPHKGTPSTWTLRTGKAETLHLLDRDDSLGRTTLSARRGDWYTIGEIPLGLYLSNGKWNRQLALGKPVYAGERLLGRIEAISDNGRQIRLSGVKGEPALPLDVVVRELEAGQRFEIPLNGFWDAP